MGQDITHKQLQEALELYSTRYGKVKIDPRKWDDIVTEVKYGYKEKKAKGKKRRRNSTGNR